MDQKYYFDQELNGSKKGVILDPKAEYESCRFLHCNFSGINLEEMKFVDCEFIECDMSNAKLLGTAFRDVQFTHCKLLGLQFDECNSFGFLVRILVCNLNHASFHKINLSKTKFTDCMMQETDFSESNLSSAEFSNCDLDRAYFRNTMLEKADFRSSYNLILDPEENKIRGAKFSQQNLPGLLRKYNIKID